VEQAGTDGAAEAVFLRMGPIAKPTQLTAQGGESDAADPVEVDRIHPERLEPFGETTGGRDLSLSRKGAELP
jgi:hypothetical protein